MSLSVGTSIKILVYFLHYSRRCFSFQGEHVLNLPIRIESGSWLVGGMYQAEIYLETRLHQTGCIKLKNIRIENRN